MELRTTEFLALVLTVCMFTIMGVGMYHKRDNHMVPVVYEQKGTNDCVMAELFRPGMDCPENNDKLDFSVPKIKAVNI